MELTYGFYHLALKNLYYFQDNGCVMCICFGER